MIVFLVALVIVWRNNALQMTIRTHQDALFAAAASFRASAEALESMAAALSGAAPSARLLSASEAAAQLSVSPATVRRLIASGELAGVLVRGRYRVSSEQVGEFVKRGGVR